MKTMFYHVFVDKASGTRSDRPGLDSCLALLKPGDTLVVWRLDRLGRSMSHLLTMVEALLSKQIGFRSLCDGAIDTTTASGELMFNIFSAYGTFYDGEKQQNMVWTVSGAANVGLPSEFAERVLVALLYIGAQNDFADRRMEFTTYQIIKVLGHELNGWNYKAVEMALNQLAGVLITSDLAVFTRGSSGLIGWRPPFLPRARAAERHARVRS